MSDKTKKDCDEMLRCVEELLRSHINAIPIDKFANQLEVDIFESYTRRKLDEICDDLSPMFKSIRDQLE